MTASEREREARRRTALAMQRERVERTMESWDAVFWCINDECAAVRSAVLAEVRRKIVPHFEWGEITEEQFLAALTALEATDGR